MQNASWVSGAPLYLTIASILDALNIRPVSGLEGKRYDPFEHCIEGITWYVTMTYIIAHTYTLKSFDAWWPPVFKVEGLIRDWEAKEQGY